MPRMSTLTAPPASANASQLVGFHCKRLRIDAKQTQHWLAEQIAERRRVDSGSIRTKIALLESGKASEASGMDWIDDIAAIFHVPAAELLQQP